MQLKKISIEVLGQLIDLCHQLSAREYSQELPLLMNNSIGKHVRHILNFFDLTIKSFENRSLDYSHRDRDTCLERDTGKTIQKIEKLIKQIGELDMDAPLILKTTYDLEGNDYLSINSCVKREIVYNIEHAIHHMAIIKIALQDSFPHIKIDPNFGIAYSTIKYQNECAR